MEDSHIDTSDERLAAIKVEGRRRRERRQRRNATFGGIAAAVLVLGIPLTLRLDDGRSDRDVLAAREDCVASTDPRCGPFHWDPVPEANEPLTATFGRGTETLEAAVGRPLEVEVFWEDPDAPEVEVAGVCWGEEPCSGLAPPCVNDSATGGWTPPQPSPGSGAVNLQHTYETPGTYELSVTLRSSSWDRAGCPPAPGDPYANDTTLSATVRVR